MEEPFLYDTVDTLYHAVMDNIPQAVQDRDMASAFVLGSGCTYGLTRGLLWAAKKLDRFIPGFSEEWLPRLEKIAAGVVVAAPIVWAIADPQSAREIMTQHPTYTSGMIGVDLGCASALLHDAYSSRQKTLEQNIKDLEREMQSK